MARISTGTSEAGYFAERRRFGAVASSSGGSGTFGNTNAEASTATLTGNFKQAWKFTNSQGGASVSKLTMRITPHATTTQKITGLIYADSAGAPGALVASSNEVSVVGGGSVSWVDFSFASPPSLSATDYWLGLISENVSAGVIAVGATASTRRYNGDTYVGGATDPFGAPITDSSGPASIYATYTF